MPDAPLPIDAPLDHRTFREIVYSEEDEIGYLSFDFYNGAMSTLQCYRLRDAYLHARARPTRVIVLLGGADFWSNGINLNAIEASADPGAESWRNINAINDLIFEILNTMSHLVVAGLRGNAGAGGAMLALAADHIYARSGIVLNPHYPRMGNLYGSEYWTYTLPRRVGGTRALELIPATAGQFGPHTTTFPLTILDGYDAQVVGIEVTQAIQPYDLPAGSIGNRPVHGTPVRYNGMPLAAGGRTAVRVFPDFTLFPEFTSVPDFFCSLSGTRDGARLSGGPIQTGGGPNPLVLGANFVDDVTRARGKECDFILPEDWPHGVISLTARISPMPSFFPPTSVDCCPDNDASP